MSRTLVLSSVVLLYFNSVTVKLVIDERSYMSTTYPSGASSQSDRDVRLAMLFFAGTFVAFILNGIWTLFVGTASFGGDEEDLIQGWDGVIRNLPGYLLLVGVASLSVWFSVRAGIHGAPRAKAALITTSFVLLFALSSVTRDSAEVVMTTRAATVAWLMFAVDAFLVGLVFLFAQLQIRRTSGR